MKKSGCQTTRTDCNCDACTTERLGMALAAAFRAYKEKRKMQARSLKGLKVPEIVARTILDRIEESGDLPWRKPWKAADTRIMSYHGHTYRGINLMLTLITDKPGPWITLKQVKKLGGRVKDEEFDNSQIVTFYKLNKYRDRDTGEDKAFPMMRFYRVWSLDQTENVPEPTWLTKRKEEQATKQINPIEAAEKVWNAYSNKPSVNHGGNRASYSPMSDQIDMPEMQTFDDSEEYYSTLFHEGVHSTGHKSRLNRFDTSALFSSGEDYSKEELIAEVGAAMLMAETGIEKVRTLDNSTAYLKHWLTRLESDPKLMIQAASKAQKAVDHMLNRTFEKEGDND